MAVDREGASAAASPSALRMESGAKGQIVRVMAAQTGLVEKRTSDVLAENDQEAAEQLAAAKSQASRSPNRRDAAWRFARWDRRRGRRAVNTGRTQPVAERPVVPLPRQHIAWQIAFLNSRHELEPLRQERLQLAPGEVIVSRNVALGDDVPTIGAKPFGSADDGVVRQAVGLANQRSQRQVYHRQTGRRGAQINLCNVGRLVLP